jgi:NIMA (never in mitosis gene a)-related kinase
MGISKSVANHSNHSLSLSKVGTPLYITPEQIKQQPFNFKVDIWALGCLLHYLACL